MTFGEKENRFWCLLCVKSNLVLLTLLFYVVGFHFGRRLLFLWFIIIFSLFVIFSEVLYLVIWAIEGNIWSIAQVWWGKLIGFLMYELSLFSV